MEKSQNDPIFSVSDLIAVVNQTFEYAYPNVFVEGEVASFKVNQGKFVFFDLKDASGSIGCFMTIWQLRTPITDGMKVVISATPKLTAGGKFSLTVKSIRPSGEGAIKKSFEILKVKLDDEGLFAPERKRLLPSVPKNIAVISSLQAAGYADFVKILNDRFGGLSVNVANVQVQGESAPDQIIRAIDYFNQLEVLPEVLVIIRGGGSADDLAAFNDEKLVRAIAASRIPTLVGVGHEIDESLADLAADVRAATPSNAAQILVPDRNEIIRSVGYQIVSLLPRVDNVIDQSLMNINQILSDAIDRVDDVAETKIERLNNLRQILAKLDPNNVLARGYALIRGKVKLGEILQIETNKVIMKAEVKDVRTK